MGQAHQLLSTGTRFGQKPMKFRPLHDCVVIRRVDAEEETVGGIIIPDTAQEKPMEGEIVAVGPGRPQRARLHRRPGGESR